MLRDRLRQRMGEMGRNVDCVQLAEHVLGIKNVPATLAERLVAEALIVGDRREEWTRAGRRICAAAPPAPGVYAFRDESGSVLYVGKANNLQQRFRSHFSPRRWLRLGPEMARVATAEWRLTGSELEALLVEAEWIRSLNPVANVQTAAPSLKSRRVPRRLLRNVVVLVPAAEPHRVTLVAANVMGDVAIARTRRDGTELAIHIPRLWNCVAGSPNEATWSRPRLAPLVFSWLAGRGADATRIDAAEFQSAEELGARAAALLADRGLFAERLIVLP